MIRPANPNTRLLPLKSTNSTSRLCPGSNRTAVPAGIFKRMPRLAARQHKRGLLYLDTEAGSPA